MQLSILLGMFGVNEILIILAIVLLLFGGRKIPELMKGIGKGMREFKKASSEDDGDNATTTKDKIKE
ncbi:MAG: twin-arginine translocase TatA/TatE family subunit [Mangrovibacterium sp.]